MTTYMFPGQGSQLKGMGKEVFNQFPNYVKQANEVLGYSIEELCLQDPNQQLANTQYTQPALYVVEALSFLAKNNDGIKPEYCIGHSLGEYAALFAAGVFDFLTGLALVKKRGELMAEVHGGGMLAVVNLSEERIRSLLTANQLDSIDFANFNSSKQIVLSGAAEEIKKAQEVLSKEATMCVLLNVSGAFHSRYMEEVAKEFRRFILSFEFNPLQIQVIANVNARPYRDDTVKENLVQQIMQSVLWTETIAFLKNKGESDFVEIGPGSVLTRLMK